MNFPFFMDSLKLPTPWQLKSAKGDKGFLLMLP